MPSLQKSSRPHPSAAPAQPRRRRRWLWAALALCLALIAAAIYTRSPRARQRRLRQMSVAALRQEALRRPDDPQVHLQLGLRLRRMGDTADAFEEISHAYEMRYEEPAYMAMMAAAYMDKNDDASADHLLRDASARAPKSPEVLAQLARLQLRHGRYASALRNAREAARLGPHLPEAWQALGRACAVEKLTDEAWTAFERALQLSGDDVETLTDYSEALARYGRVREAEAALRRALKTAPRAPRSLGLLGAQLAARARTPQERKEAATLLARAIEVAPQGTEQRYHLGMLLLRDGRPADAVRQLKTCLALDPTYGEAHDGLGRAYARLGRDKESQAHFTAFRRYTDYRREATHLELRLRRAPRDLNLLLRMARLHENYGVLRWALVYYRRALAVRPDAEMERHLMLLEKKALGASLPSEPSQATPHTH